MRIPVLAFNSGIQFWGALKLAKRVVILGRITPTSIH